MRANRVRVTTLLMSVGMLLHTIMVSSAVAQAPSMASVHWAVDAGKRGREQLFVRTAITPTWQGKWGIDHARLSVATAFQSGDAACNATNNGCYARPFGYANYAAFDLGHSFSVSHSATRHRQLLIAPGVLYGFGSRRMHAPQFASSLRATLRTSNRLGHGSELHVQWQRGILDETVVEYGVGFHLRLWSGG